MKLFALLLILHLSHAHKNFDKCVNGHQLLENNWEHKLENKIMCNYDYRVPPKGINGSDLIKIRPHFIVKSFRLLSEEQEFSVFTWAILRWSDERLKWDSNDYDGITEIILNGFSLWLPGIKLYNSISDFYDQSFESLMPCRITSHGSVLCISFIRFQTKCLTDLNDWPFDVQVCSLEFGPWLSSGTKIYIDVRHESVSFIGSDHGGDWDIMDYEQEENHEADIQMKLHFTLLRHADGLAAIVIFPSILLSILTLSTLFLDVRRNSRVCIMCFSLLCHLLFLSELGMNIPKHSKKSPRILLYFRCSVIMTIISIVLTFLMKRLCESAVPVPNMIAFVNENVYKTYIKMVIYPRWNATADDDDKRELAKAWTDFVSMLNSVWVYVSLIVYTVMCCVYIPSPSGLEQMIYVQSYEFE